MSDAWEEKVCKEPKVRKQRLKPEWAFFTTALHWCSPVLSHKAIYPNNVIILDPGSTGISVASRRTLRRSDSVLKPFFFIYAFVFCFVFVCWWWWWKIQEPPQLENTRGKLVEKWFTKNLGAKGLSLTQWKWNAFNKRSLETVFEV